MSKKTSNSNLKSASKAKNDEFYTQLTDIEKELKHYKGQFRGKVVYCNCDDPFESNFFKYFASNFNALGLKQLIATSYKPSPIANTQLGLFGKDEVLSEPKGRPKVTANKFLINEVNDINGDGAFDLDDIAEQLKANKNNEWSPMSDEGDFRSEESIELLKKADIVVTNPPFSLFREYVEQLDTFNKKFLIIGNTNAITYKEIFKLIKENKLRTGYTNFNVGMFFVVPDGWEKFHHIDERGNKIARVSTSCWFTNLEVEKHKEEITLYKKYTPEEYPKYDNYDAINVDKVTDIPLDYEGCIGVPITFIDKYNPDQFEIIGFTHRNDPYNLKTKIYTKQDADNFNDLNGSPILKDKDGIRFIYMRIIIRNKKVKK
jgi:hypothetical protein